MRNPLAGMDGLDGLGDYVGRKAEDLKYGAQSMTAMPPGTDAHPVDRYLWNEYPKGGYEFNFTEDNKPNGMHRFARGGWSDQMRQGYIDQFNKAVDAGRLGGSQYAPYLSESDVETYGAMSNENARMLAEARAANNANSADAPRAVDWGKVMDERGAVGVAGEAGKGFVNEGVAPMVGGVVDFFLGNNKGQQARNAVTIGNGGDQQTLAKPGLVGEQPSTATETIAQSAQKTMLDEGLANEVNQAFKQALGNMPWINQYNQGGKAQQSFQNNYLELMDRGYSPGQAQDELKKRAIGNRNRYEVQQETQQIKEFLDQPNPYTTQKEEIKTRLRGAEKGSQEAIYLTKKLVEAIEGEDAWDENHRNIAGKMRVAGFGRRMRRKAIEDPTRNMSVAESIAHKNPEKAKAAQERWDNGEATQYDAWLLGQAQSQRDGTEARQHNQERKRAIVFEDAQKRSYALEVAKMSQVQRKQALEYLQGNMASIDARIRELSGNTDMKEKDRERAIARLEAERKPYENQASIILGFGGNGGGMMSQSEMEQARAWANSNPNDPRAKEILKRLNGE
ncbi:MAG: hypothetical protein JW713_05870 [Pontiellaceae bacterium]|nr:hypothetical protein [Pontiellaceae bacterium]